jgi:hypothetical protein
MSYRPIEYGHISDDKIRMVFHRADLYLGDVYSMFNVPRKGPRRGGACNYAIVLTLMCVIDGIAGDIYPKRSVIRKDANRFKTLIWEKLFWGKSAVWMDKRVAAKELYLGFRNPLVHELGRDRPQNTKPELLEPIVGPWGRVPDHLRSIDRIDRLKAWDEAWPIMAIEPRDGGRAIKLVYSGLYWAVKQMVAKLAKEAAASKN